MTGEPDLRKKIPCDYMKAGATVGEGFGKMLVASVGENTDSGKAQAILKAQAPQETPLQQKLDHMAKQIGLSTLVLSKIPDGCASLTDCLVPSLVCIARPQARSVSAWLSSLLSRL